MSLAGCQISPIDANFHLQKSPEIFDKNSADKNWSKNDKEIKVSPLMLIRVKHTHDLNFALPVNIWMQLNVCIVWIMNFVSWKQYKDVATCLVSIYLDRMINLKIRIDIEWIYILLVAISNRILVSFFELFE